MYLAYIRSSGLEDIEDRLKSSYYQLVDLALIDKIAFITLTVIIAIAAFISFKATVLPFFSVTNKHALIVIPSGASLLAFYFSAIYIINAFFIIKECHKAIPLVYSLSKEKNNSDSDTKIN